MNHIMREFLEKFVLVYIDDVIIYSETFEEHIEHLKQVFEKLRESNLMVKLKKCEFGKQEITFLGHVIGKNGIKPDPAKVEKIKNLKEPTNLRELRSVLGLCSYYRKFVKNFSKIVKPMTKLLGKDEKYVWGESQQKAFETMKEILTSEPVLKHPIFGEPFILITDASQEGLGAVLAQKDDDGKEAVIAYASKSLV